MLINVWAGIGYTIGFIVCWLIWQTLLDFWKKGEEQIGRTIWPAVYVSAFFKLATTVFLILMAVNWVVLFLETLKARGLM